MKMKVTSIIFSLIFIFSAITPICVYAEDGLKWNKNTDVLETHLNSVCYGDGIYVAVGDDGTIKTSKDGDKWTSQNSGTLNRLTSLGDNTTYSS